jgi:hypothetical protein
MSWRWSLTKQLEDFVFPDSKHQGSEDELSVVRELNAECPISDGLTWMELERFLLLGAALSTSHHQIF